MYAIKTSVLMLQDVVSVSLKNISDIFCSPFAGHSTPYPPIAWVKKFWSSFFLTENQMKMTVLLG